MASPLNRWIDGQSMQFGHHIAGKSGLPRPYTPDITMWQFPSLHVPKRGGWWFATELWVSDFQTNHMAYVSLWNSHVRFLPVHYFLFLSSCWNLFLGKKNIPIQLSTSQNVEAFNLLPVGSWFRISPRRWIHAWHVLLMFWCQLGHVFSMCCGQACFFTLHRSGYCWNDELFFPRTWWRFAKSWQHSQEIFGMLIRKLSQNSKR